MQEKTQEDDNSDSPTLDSMFIRYNKWLLLLLLT